MNIFLRSASVLLPSLAALSACAAGFQNGSFESALIDPGDYTRLYPGSTALPGWTVASGNVDYIGTRWQSSDGSRDLDLSGDEAGSVSQTFDTVAGRAYSVLFDMAGNPDAGPTTKSMLVSAADSSSSYSFDTTVRTQTSMGWTTMSFSFTATSASTMLAFASTTYTDYGPTLDNVRVSINPTPEPSALAALGLGAVALVKGRKRA